MGIRGYDDLDILLAAEEHRQGLLPIGDREDHCTACDIVISARRRSHLVRTCPHTGSFRLERTSTGQYEVVCRCGAVTEVYPELL